MTVTFCDGLNKSETCEHDIDIDRDYSDLDFTETKKFLYEHTDTCSKCGLTVRYTKYKWMPLDRKIRNSDGTLY